MSVKCMYRAMLMIIKAVNVLIVLFNVLIVLFNALLPCAIVEMRVIIRSM